MQHLSTERLAALADETPTQDEAVHLAHCLACRRERDVYLALLDLARREGSAGVEPGALAPVGEPISSWDAISAGLLAEGLISDRASRAPARRSAPATPAASAAAPQVRALRPAATWWRQAAAASVLLVAGIGVGRTTAGLPLIPRQAPSAQTADAGSLPGSFDGGLTLPSAGAARPAFASVTEASSALARAQREYQRAAAFLAEHDTTSVVAGSDALRARLAALDEVIPRVREALYDAPQDPVLSQYYQATYEARETTLRQLGRTLPAGVRLTGY